VRFKLKEIEVILNGETRMSVLTMKNLMQDLKMRIGPLGLNRIIRAFPYRLVRKSADHTSRAIATGR